LSPEIKNRNNLIQQFHSGLVKSM